MKSRSSLVSLDRYISLSLSIVVVCVENNDIDDDDDAAGNLNVSCHIWLLWCHLSI